MYMLIYVDDIIIISSAETATSRLISQLQKDFAIKDLGDLTYFLGIEISQCHDGLLLTQRKYIGDLLGRLNMSKINGAVTPMVATDKLSRHSGTPLLGDAITRYRSAVGALQYLVLTRPNIAFSVNKVCQFLSKPTEEHWTAVKRILRYLHDTAAYGLLIRKSSSLFLSGFSDADWAGDVDDRRSTGGHAIFLGPNLVAWHSKKQPTSLSL